jgi:hypothetical protein
LPSIVVEQKYITSLHTFDPHILDGRQFHTDPVKTAPKTPQSPLCPFRKNQKLTPTRVSAVIAYDKDYQLHCEIAFD